MAASGRPFQKLPQTGPGSGKTNLREFMGSSAPFLQSTPNPAWIDAPHPDIVASLLLSRYTFGRRRNKDKGPIRSHRAHPLGRDQNISSTHLDRLLLPH